MSDTRLWRQTLVFMLVRSLGPVILSISGGLLLAALAVRLLGADPGEFFALLYQGTLGSAYGFSQVLFKATPLIFTGLAVAFGFQAGLFNIGAEGQMVLGALGAVIVGVWLADAPPMVAIPLCTGIRRRLDRGI